MTPKWPLLLLSLYITAGNTKAIHDQPTNRTTELSGQTIKQITPAMAPDIIPFTRAKAVHRKVGEQDKKTDENTVVVMVLTGMLLVSIFGSVFFGCYGRKKRTAIGHPPAASLVDITKNVNK
ncbi:hypothetical protein HDE_00257 [Halotydeus destructor]|nr:hypothetical protein HDE_00257 [Halotydeus destructor]